MGNREVVDSIFLTVLTLQTRTISNGVCKQSCPNGFVFISKKEEESPGSIYHRKGCLFLQFKGVCATFISRSELLGIKMWLRLVWEAF